MSAIELDPGVGGQCVGESALEAGDLIVSTTAARVSRGIRTATSSPVSHAMLYVGNGQVIEAIQEGVVERPLSTITREPWALARLRSAVSSAWWCSGSSVVPPRAAVCSSIQAVSSVRNWFWNPFGESGCQSAAFHQR